MPLDLMEAGYDVVVSVYNLHGTPNGIQRAIKLYQKESPIVLISLPRYFGEDGRSN